MRYKRFSGYLDYLNTFFLRGKDLFINLWIDASPIWNEIYLKEKKNTKQNKSCLQHEAWLRIKTESPNAYYDNLMHMFECSQKSSDNLPTPTPHPAPHHRTVLFSNSGWSTVTFMRYTWRSLPDHRSYRSENQNTSVILPRRWSSYVIWFVLNIGVEAWVAQIIS